MVMNYKVQISSHPGIIFGNGDVYGMLFRYLDLHHLNENCKTANAVNAQHGPGPAGAHVRLSCQTSAGLLGPGVSALQCHSWECRVCRWGDAQQP